MSQRLFVSRISIKFTYHQEPQCVGEREREAAGRVNAMAVAFCVDCGLQLTGRYCGECGRDYGASVSMQEPGDDDDNNEEDEEGVEEVMIRMVL